MEDPFIYINNNSLSKELCDDIIEIYEKCDIRYKSLTVGGFNPNILKANMCECKEISDKKWIDIDKCLKNELIYNLGKYIKQIDTDKYQHFFSFNITGFRIQKYDINDSGMYTFHMDELIEYETLRKITFIWYLNDVYDGGETAFYNKKIQPTVGKLLLFPSTWTYPHSSIPVISNNKYIIVGWIRTIID